jgi:hypothetical protein
MIELAGGLLGLIWLFILFWAVLRTLQSAATPLVKLVWVVVLIFFPLFGFIMWLLVGPRARRW